MVEQVVGEFVEEVIGVDVEAGLGAVPAGIGEVRGLTPVTSPTTTENHDVDPNPAPDRRKHRPRGTGAVRHESPAPELTC